MQSLNSGAGKEGRGRPPLPPPTPLSNIDNIDNEKRAEEDEMIKCPPKWNCLPFEIAHNLSLKVGGKNSLDLMARLHKFCICPAK